VTIRLAPGLTPNPEDGAVSELAPVATASRRGGSHPGMVDHSVEGPQVTTARDPLPSDRLPGRCAANSAPPYLPTGTLGSTIPPLLLTKVEAARLLTVSVRQVSRWLSDGSLAPIRLGPRLVRLSPEELTAFVARQSSPTPPPVAWPTRDRRRTWRRTA
jgi:excisionase family DNA binding protein